MSAPSKTSFGDLRKWDWSGLCPFPHRKMTGREQGGVGNRIIGGGVQNHFWGGVSWYVFPSPEFSSRLCFPLTLLKYTTCSKTHPACFLLSFATNFGPQPRPPLIPLNRFLCIFRRRTGFTSFGGLWGLFSYIFLGKLKKAKFKNLGWSGVGSEIDGDFCTEKGDCFLLVA